jgi:glycosyltransferase involved in cell wall biosynthesis
VKLGYEMNSKHIVFVCRDDIESIPPILNSIFILSRMGHRISVISTFIEDDIRELLNKKHGVQFHLMGKIIRGKHLLTTANNNRRFRGFAIRKMNELNDSAEIFWLSGETTALSLYNAPICKKIKYIFSCHELYDHSSFFKLIVKKFMLNSSMNIVPEYNRAQIYRQWFQLAKSPFVLPNKTTLLFEKLKELNAKRYDTEKVTNISKEIKEQANGRRVVLYQGRISKIRQISKVVIAVKKMPDEFFFVLMGEKNEYVKELKKILPELYYIDYIPAPFHLNITQIVDIGFLAYDYSRLNHIFCAPNKIFEYSMFGLPMICNDVSGLSSTVGAAQAGLCVDFSSVDKIVSALRQLDKNYGKFRENSLNFYNTVDISNLHSELIENI